MTLLLIIGAALALQTAPGAASDEPQPHWLSRPTGAQLIAVFPKAALRASKPGRVIMRCGVNPDGTLKDCKITEETPKGFGFGEAVLSLVPLYKIAPTTEDGTPTTEGDVPITVQFRL